MDGGGETGGCPAVCVAACLSSCAAEPLGGAREEQSNAAPPPRPHACSLEAQLQDVEEQREQWRLENVRRRFDFVPLIFNILTGLAAGGQLQPLVERGVAAARAKREAAAAGGQQQ